MKFNFLLGRAFANSERRGSRQCHLTVPQQEADTAEFHSEEGAEDA